MEATPTRPRWNYRRRAIGVAVCLSPVALLITSLFAEPLVPHGSEVSLWAHRVGFGFAVCALLPTALNVYIALRPAIHRWRYGSMDGFRSISGAPAIGTFLAVVAGLVGFGDWRVATIALFALAFDFGGLPWFLIGMWSDQGLWDE